MATVKNHSPAVSVVMPVYNGEPYLNESVESIVNQTFVDFEFIIVDDGSTDCTREILAQYAKKDTRIVLCHNQQNNGIIKTLNKGLALARGKYIARHDADDVSLPERLGKQVAYLEQHEEVGLLGTAYYRLNSRGQRSLRQPPITDTEIRWRMLFDNIWPHPAMMFRRRLFNAHEPFYNDFLHAEDYELWVRLLMRARGATLSDPLVIIRDHEQGGIRANHHEEMTKTARNISARQINALIQLEESEADVLHRCYHAKQLSKKDIVIGGQLVFDLFNTFERQRGVDPHIVGSIRRRWIKRLLTVIGKRQYETLWSSVLLVLILRYEAKALLMALFICLPRQILRECGCNIHLWLENKKCPRACS